jgi:ATP-dependent Clp protease ATP-binding subunit ClpA
MTSNALYNKNSNSLKLGFSDNSAGAAASAAAKIDETKTELAKIFPKEFLDRIEKIIHFNYLSKNDLQRILDREIEILSESLAVRGSKLTLSSGARKYLMGKIGKAKDGARPIRQVLRAELSDPLSLFLLMENETTRKSLFADIDEKENQLIIKTAEDNQ